MLLLRAVVRLAVVPMVASCLLGSVVEAQPAPAPSPVRAPTTTLSLMLSGGTASWSGPFLAGNKSAGLFGLAFTRRVRPQWGVRAELASSPLEGDLTVHGATSERAYLSVGRASAALLGRRYFTPDTVRTQWYADAGLAVFSQGCSVNESGGLSDVGFFPGDVTQSCETFEDTQQRRLFSKVGHGAGVVLAVGVDHGRLGLQLRAEPLGTAVAQATGGDITARTVTLMLQWHAWRR